MHSWPGLRNMVERDCHGVAWYDPGASYSSWQDEGMAISVGSMVAMVIDIT